jgi:uncharacterized protein (DUF433 family)
MTSADDHMRKFEAELTPEQPEALDRWHAQYDKANEEIIDATRRRETARRQLESARRMGSRGLPIAELVARAIIKIRMEEDLSLQDLARELGVDLDTVVKLESGDPECDPREVIAALDLLVRPLDDTGFIVSDPDVMHGRPMIRGTRLLAEGVRRRIDAGDSFEMFERERPDVAPEAFRAAYAYATARQRQRQRRALEEMAEINNEDEDGSGWGV